MKATYLKLNFFLSLKRKSEIQLIISYHIYYSHYIRNSYCIVRSIETIEKVENIASSFKNETFQLYQALKWTQQRTFI